MNTVIPSRKTFIVGAFFAVVALCALPQTTFAATVNGTLKEAMDIEPGDAPDFGDIAVAGISVSASINGSSTLYTGATDSTGAFSISTPSVNEGDLVTVFVNNNSTYSGATIAKVEASTEEITVSELFNKAIRLTDHTGGTLSGANVAAAIAGISDSDLTNILSANSTTIQTKNAHTLMLNGDFGHPMILDRDIISANDVVVTAPTAFGNHNVTIAENFVFAADVSIGSGTLTFGRVFYPFNYMGLPTFTSGTSTVTCSGTDCTIYENNTFYNLTLIDSAVNGVANTVSFQSEKTQTVTHALRLQGEKYSARLNVKSLTAGSRATIALTGSATATLRNLAVKDLALTDVSSAVSVPLNACGSTNAGNTVNWFTTSGMTTEKCTDEQVTAFTVSQKVLKPTKKGRTYKKVVPGNKVQYEMVVKNTGDTTLKTVPLETRYPKAYLKFSSSSKKTKDKKNDGIINWKNVAPSGGLQPGKSVKVTVTYVVSKTPKKASQKTMSHVMYVKKAVDSRSQTQATESARNILVKIK